MGLGDINLSGVVNIEFSPGSWVEFSHIGFHFSFRYLFSDEEDLGGGFLASIFIENLLSGSLSSGIGNWDGIMVEDVVHYVILISTVVS